MNMFSKIIMGFSILISGFCAIEVAEQLYIKSWDKGLGIIQSMDIEPYTIKNQVYYQVKLEIEFAYKEKIYTKSLKYPDTNWIRGSNPKVVANKIYPINGSIVIYINPTNPLNAHSQEFVESPYPLVALFCFVMGAVGAFILLKIVD